MTVFECRARWIIAQEVCEVCQGIFIKLIKINEGVAEECPRSVGQIRKLIKEMCLSTFRIVA